MKTQYNNYLDILSGANTAVKVREWERSNLPVEQSVLALDLFLIICIYTLLEKPLTLKLLFHSLDFSEAGIRKHLRRLLAEEWCILTGADHDKRLRHIVAQKKMIEALKCYINLLNNSFGNKLHSNAEAHLKI